MTKSSSPPLAHADLFGQRSALLGFRYGEQLVGAAEQHALAAAIDAVDPQPFRFQQWTGKRLTHSYGWSYDFESGVFAPADPIPDWLLPVREISARFADVDAGDLEQALLTRYDPGAGIGWHRDRPVFDHVVGISMGAAAPMRFRRREGAKFARASHLLAPGSIYHLSGEARYAWEHSIAAMDATRWSITFRSLVARN